MLSLWTSTAGGAVLTNVKGVGRKVELDHRCDGHIARATAGIPSVVGLADVCSRPHPHIPFHRLPYRQGVSSTPSSES